MCFPPRRAWVCARARAAHCPGRPVPSAVIPRLPSLCPHRRPHHPDWLAFPRPLRVSGMSHTGALHPGFPSPELFFPHPLWETGFCSALRLFQWCCFSGRGSPGLLMFAQTPPLPHSHSSAPPPRSLAPHLDWQPHVSCVSSGSAPHSRCRTPRGTSDFCVRSSTQSSTVPAYSGHSVNAGPK